MKQVCKTFTLAVGLVCAGCVFSCRAADRAVSSLRPYEMEWAGRTADDRPPLCALVDTVGWTIDCQNAEATFTRATDRLLFGDGVARLTYRSLGGSDKPRVFVRPPAPIPIVGEFDAISCWVFGNNVFGRDPTTPSVTIDAQFIGAAMHAAVAAGLYGSVAEAQAKMCAPTCATYRPQPDHNHDARYKIYRDMGKA